MFVASLASWLFMKTPAYLLMCKFESQVDVAFRTSRVEDWLDASWRGESTRNKSLGPYIRKQVQVRCIFSHVKWNLIEHKPSIKGKI